MNKKQGSSGVLFQRQKKSQNGPDVGGDIILDVEEIEYIIKRFQNRQEVKLEVSGWRRMGRNNTAFTSLSVQIPYADRNQQPDRSQFSQPSFNRSPQRPLDNEPKGPSRSYASVARGEEKNPWED